MNQYDTHCGEKKEKHDMPGLHALPGPGLQAVAENRIDDKEDDPVVNDLEPRGDCAEPISFTEDRPEDLTDGHWKKYQAAKF